MRSVSAARCKLPASAHECAFCLEKFQAGAEMYGGLGDTDSFGTHLTSQYLGPTVNWTAPNGMTIGIFATVWAQQLQHPCVVSLLGFLRD